MNKLFLLLFILVEVLFLSGCATLQPVSQLQTQNWVLQGKIGVKTPEQTGSASLYWRQQGDVYHIRLFGPLGIGAVELNGNPNLVTYTDNHRKIYQSHSAELLLKQNADWQIPINNLKYWVCALPVSDIPSQKSYNTQHQLISLQQQGWKIDYSSYQHNMPHLIQLTRPGINLRIVINQFQYFH